MADLSYSDRRKFEGLLSMGSGYVLGFSNRTFEEFVWDVVVRNIYDEAYSGKGHSKANRLRAFWEIEDNHTVGLLLLALVEAAESGEQELRDECRQIGSRLAKDSPVPDIRVLRHASGRTGMDALARQVRESIEKKQPEMALDRLHTYTLRFVRELCDKRGISTDRNKALHGLFGEYVRSLKKDGLIETRMTEMILKSSISVMEAYNEVRNDWSLAHDNDLLRSDESLFILKNVLSVMDFVNAIEGRRDAQERERKLSIERSVGS